MARTKQPTRKTGYPDDDLALAYCFDNESESETDVPHENMPTDASQQGGNQPLVSVGSKARQHEEIWPARKRDRMARTNIALSKDSQSQPVVSFNDGHDGSDSDENISDTSEADTWQIVMVNGKEALTRVSTGGKAPKRQLSMQDKPIEIEPKMGSSDSEEKEARDLKRRKRELSKMQAWSGEMTTRSRKLEARLRKTEARLREMEARLRRAKARLRKTDTPTKTCIRMEIG